MISLDFLLVEVALQQAFESLAVAGLVTGHFMNGVMNGVQAQSLSLLGQFGFAHGGAVFSLNADGQVFLRGGGDDLAQ